MAGLARAEFIVFIAAVVMYAAAAVVSILQIIAKGRRYGKLLAGFAGGAIALEIVMLAMRAREIQAVPLTGMFESMMVLTVVMGLMYLVLSITIRQEWFDCVMVWIILLMVVIAGAVATPAAKPIKAAATPWAIVHGIAMVLGGAALTFATVTAVLYLISWNKLKSKKVGGILGKVPNLQKLEYMNMRALEICFLFVTFGVVLGVGMAVINAAALDISIKSWLMDSKIVLILFIWTLLGVALILRHVTEMTGKMMAYLTITAFVLVIFAIAGTAVFCGTKHDFSKSEIKVLEINKQAQ